jgi:hypothetical protein
MLDDKLEIIMAGRRPARIDPDIAPLRPAELLKFLPERGDLGLPFRVALGIRHKRTNPPHSIRLLRARRERPDGRRTAEQRDERAPLHSSTSSARASSDGGELLWFQKRNDRSRSPIADRVET